MQRCLDPIRGDLRLMQCGTVPMREGSGSMQDGIDPIRAGTAYWLIISGVELPKLATETALLLVD